MANEPDWGKRGVIAAYIVGIPAVGMAVLAYVHPTDTAHPIRFDFLYSQVSFSVSIWTFFLDVIGATAIAYLAWTIIRRRRKPLLVIQSAFYGADNASDRDVTKVIRRAVASNNTVSLWIDNNCFGVDPRIGKRKQLKVHYSYGNGGAKSVIRPENTLLVLPEDEWLKSLYTQACQTISELRAGLTPLSPEYLKLENDYNELKKNVFAFQQAQASRAHELDAARKQLEMPKIMIAVVAFEAYEEKSEEALTPTARLLYPSNNRILIWVGLKISNEHRIATNIQSLGLSIQASALGGAEHLTPPDSFPETMKQPIPFGMPLQLSLDFWIEHADAQSIVKNYFVVAGVDGVGQQFSSAPQQITRVLPKVAAATSTAAEPLSPPSWKFDFDPKKTRLRINADQTIALELDKSNTGTLGITVAPVNTTTKMIASYRIEVAEAFSWSERHKQFAQYHRFNRKPAVRGTNLEPLSKQNAQFLVRVASKDGVRGLTVYNDDSTPLTWPNDDSSDAEIWLLTLVTVY